MRIVKEIQHPQCKITIFSWNNRYLIKIEQGLLEQTYKINTFDVNGEDDVESILSDGEFIDDCLKRFEEMHSSLHKVLEKN